MVALGRDLEEVGAGHKPAGGSRIQGENHRVAQKLEAMGPCTGRKGPGWLYELWAFNCAREENTSRRIGLNIYNKEI